MSYVSLLRPNGQSVRVDPTKVIALQDTFDPSVTAMTYLLAPEAPVFVQGDRATVRAALVAGGAAFATLTLVDGTVLDAAGTWANHAEQVTAGTTRVFPLTNPRHRGWLVDDTLANVTAALTAAGGGSFPGGASPSEPFVIASGIISGGGTVLAGNVNVVVPYVPASGVYNLGFAAPSRPYTFFNAQVTQVQTPALDIVYGVSPPLSPTTFNVAGRQIGGGVWGDYAFAVTVIGVP